MQFGFQWKIGNGKTLLFEGEKDHLVPSMSQVIVDSDLFLVAGRIIGHSFLHNGPCLTGLSQAIVHVLSGGMPEMACIDMEDCCDTDVRETVRLLEGSTILTAEQKRSIQELALGWDLPGVTNENKRWLLEKLLFHAVLGRSRQQIKQLKRGLKETRVMDQLTERPDTIPLLFPRSSSVSYQPHVILDRVTWPMQSDTDDEDDDTSLEDKCHISGFLRKFIEDVSI
ncbi:uncharacterized protein LOC119905489 [Micropterus salmoides]|uniref:uncharacterized protein LOC119905489 n=1 Tax=Micropterus salmoides TaxID=27706 RepID=UPI0018ED1BEA|nr:uncharacterized protein LOC119905489 [Micropterus salmoides]